MRHRIIQNIVSIFITLFLIVSALPVYSEELPADLLTPIGKIISDSTEEVCPGVIHIHRKAEGPLNIHILIVDVKEPGISFQTCLGGGKAVGLETVRSMATRKGAVAAVNGDYWTFGGIPLGLTIVDGEIIIAPKYRTAFGIQWDGTPVIDRWSEGWVWNAKVHAPGGASYDIKMMNSDLGEGWLCLYTDQYGLPSKGNSVSPITEVVCNLEHRVIDIRTDQPGVEIPSGGFILSGRGQAGQWLSENFGQGDFARIDLKSSKPWQELKQAIGAGPRILKSGQFVQDPVQDMPGGEEFTLDWKRGHYYNRYPRTAIGVSEDHSKVILATVDGRQPEFSIGVYQKQMADLLLEFGAWDGMDLDSGGSTTMVIHGELVNHPSDHAGADGTGGRERSVSDALLILYRPLAQEKPLPGTVNKEQHELNIKY